MSIQPSSVLRRILDDARRNPHASFAREEIPPEAFRAESPRQRITWLRAPASAFTTQFEFWAHALQVWLEERGVPQYLEAIVGNASCEPVGEVALRAAVDARLAGAHDPRRLELGASFASAYRMLELDVLASYAIETDSEMLAFFWEDLDWL